MQPPQLVNTFVRPIKINEHLQMEVTQLCRLIFIDMKIHTKQSYYIVNGPEIPIQYNV